MATATARVTFDTDPARLLDLLRRSYAGQIPGTAVRISTAERVGPAETYRIVLDGDGDPFGTVERALRNRGWAAEGLRITAFTRTDGAAPAAAPAAPASARRAIVTVGLEGGDNPAEVVRRLLGSYGNEIPGTDVRVVAFEVADAAATGDAPTHDAPTDDPTAAEPVGDTSALVALLTQLRDSHAEVLEILRNRL